MVNYIPSERNRILLLNLKQRGTRGVIEKRLQRKGGDSFWRRIAIFKADGEPLTLWLQPGHYRRVYNYPERMKRPPRSDPFTVFENGAWEWDET